MKTQPFTFAMVFIFSTVQIFSQDVHKMLDNYFNNFTIGTVTDHLKIKKRYAEDAKIQTIINRSYANFQKQIENSLSKQLPLDFPLATRKFYKDLALEIEGSTSKPKNPDVPKAWNGPCENMNFENGDLSGWNLFIGEADGSSVYSYVNSLPAAPGPNHQIVGAGIDPVVGIPTVFPDGGNFSVRLGDGNTTGAVAARMTQSFLVDATNYFYTYNYAVVFENPNGHIAEERPYFTVRVYDELGGNIACGEYSVYADPANASDYQVSGDVLYKNWTSVFTNLSAFIGQNVTVEFTIGDCSLGGHYGYVYLDASCALQELTASDINLCPGETSVLTAPAGIGAYLWNTGETTQSITVATGGHFTCQLTPLQGPACSVILDIDINLLPIPNANFVINNPNTCLNDSTSFTNLSTITNPGIISSYQWDFGDAIITPFSNGTINGVSFTNGNYLLPKHSYQNPGIYQVVLNLNTADGCVASDTQMVQVFNLPIAVAGIDQVICEGTSITLSGAGANTYSWNNGITNGLAFTPSVGTYQYELTATAINGCKDIDTVMVTVNPMPNLDAGTDINGCEGISVTLNATGAVNYTWSNGLTNNSSFIPIIGNHVLHVNGSNNFGCFKVDSIMVSIHPNPNVSTNDVEICKGESAVLKGNGALNYQWTNGIIDNQAFYPTEDGSYTVYGKDIFNCIDSAIAKVIVHELPESNFKPSSRTATNVNPTIQFINTSVGALTYDWDFGDGSLSSNLFSPSHAFPTEKPDFYTVTLTVTNQYGCKAIHQDVIQVEDELIIFVPNTFTPDNNGVNNEFKPVLADGFDPQDYVLYIFNRWGEIVFESHDTNFGWKGDYAFNNGQAQDGTYNWKIEVKEEFTTKRHVFTGHVNILR